MKDSKKKDALTDLVEEMSEPTQDAKDEQLKEGEAIANSGEVVTLGNDKEFVKAIRNYIRAFRKKRKK